ncbi:probable serine/threonine-protein kinase DDB_G0278665 isoform X3 [Lucilia sericata]|uniref:probable serine/threonine-protein kinase DDB_G0278665 isoform X3 n=1 Tax=Lucilia sericata TaxID=13632 RepID=UPI0018A8814B|nr:probable serine/threonine-protein kinase DDB_G0278665 isoform X3 [Lucilia sericata]
MLVHSNASSTPTPGSSSSTSNTLEPVTTSTNSSSSQLHQHLQQSSSSTFSLQQPQQKQQMGCTSTLNSRPPSRAPSILDSPTLARVERARLRLEASAQHQNLNDSCGSIINTLNGEDSLERAILDPNKQSLLAGRVPVSSMTGPIKRGLLWQQRDRLFSRWKERYFILTRDYLHCFKRASGSANDRASDMGQFIFKVKLVDVEKVEWLNRRSYSAIGLLLGREGRVLLRCDEGLEDWFELLEECTITSKERRKALKIAQGPRSRASLAAPVSHASLQSNHFGLGGTYSSALDDWLMTNGSGMGGVRGQKLVTNSMCGYGGTNPFLFSDSVPDLSVLNNENHNHSSGLSTNHSTPQKIPYSASSNSSRYSNGYTSQNSSFSNCNGLYGSPRRIFINSSFGSTHIVDEEAEDGEVELRRPRIFRHMSTENGNELDRDWLYRKPKAPTDMRHSVQPMLPTHNNTSYNKQISDLDYSAHDSGLDTPPSTHRPSSYREPPQHNSHARASPRDSTETSVSSSRGTMLNSPGGSFRAKQVRQVSNLNQVNALHGSRYSVQERVLKIRNEEEHCTSIKSSNRMNHNELYDPNQNRYYKNGNQPPTSMTPQNTPVKMQQLHSHNLQMQNQYQTANGNGNVNTVNNNNNSINVQNGSAIFRERYQHPALAAIINEAQGMKFRDRSYSDCQQMPLRRSVNNNPSPLTNRRNHVNPIFGTPTRV